MLEPAPPHTDLTYADLAQGLKLYSQTAGASALFDAIDYLSSLSQSHICSTVSRKQAQLTTTIPWHLTASPNPNRSINHLFSLQDMQ